MRWQNGNATVCKTVVRGFDSLQFHLIDLENDRHAEVFKDDAAILDAGYGNQDASDLLAITLPTNKIGIPANNIKHFNKKMAGRTFGELQRERREKRLKKLENA